MNFLAHAWLNPPCSETLLGNMSADFTGNQPPDIWTANMISGRKLHLAIDSFTDRHPLFLEMRRSLAPLCGLYASVLADVWLDHILAKQWYELSPILPPLPQFAADIYQKLRLHQSYFPENFNFVFSHMQRHDWLSNYAHISGIERTINGLTQRSPAFLPWFQQFGSDIIGLMTDSLHPHFQSGKTLLIEASRRKQEWPPPPEHAFSTDPTSSFPRQDHMS